ncbi:ParB/RepB/Spo0J family partition protein [Streptomyces sp. NPDC003388]|uniref:ParB/RepB/Spo0J family partition protein n=1 Tax=unclassified Streptomyces TaxID=2593676 RepID=UPI0024823F66|nr:ParB/RepB/Spo0J family partition protein [Streptomyces sp. ATE26]MDI1453148.1 ParB/RepB/Spo0J family partition protein [Streptomyces sp. ATE26]
MTSKASALGSGRFGSRTAAPVSARRQAVAAATGVPTEGVAPPTKLPVDRISPNPDNPRSSLGDLAELAGSLVEHGQKQAITVMNRDAYVKANPAREKDLDPHATHVVIDGSSRLAAAREAGLTHLKVWVDDEQGQDSEALLESALVANIHRQDLAELDEARALERLLVIHGSQSALAKRLHKSQGWISQRLALLNLTPELQGLIGTEPIKLLRAVGNKPHEQQAEALAELKRQSAQKGAAKQQPSSASSTGGGTQSHYPVIGDGGAGSSEQRSSGDGVQAQQEPGVSQQRAEVSSPEPSQAETVAEEAGGGIPEPREQTSSTEVVGRRKPTTLPYDDPTFISMHLDTKMEVEHFVKAVRQMVSRSWDKAGAEVGLELLGSMLDEAAKRCPEDLELLIRQRLDGSPSKTA